MMIMMTTLMMMMIILLDTFIRHKLINKQTTQHVQYNEEILIILRIKNAIQTSKEQKY